MDAAAETHNSPSGRCEAPPPQGTTQRGILLTLALVVITFVAYWPVIHEGGFIWDDDDYVTANKTLLDFLELEGKTCGLIGNKIPQNEQVKKAESTEELLNFGSRRAFAGQQDPLENLTMNRDTPKKKRVAKKTPV